MQRVWGSSWAKTTGHPAADKSLRCSNTCQEPVEAEDTGSGDEKLGAILVRGVRKSQIVQGLENAVRIWILKAR